jgi:DNA modification methylase
LQPNSRVIDPFLGTGTTAIAAHYAGHDFVGIELDEDYFKAAKKRFDESTKQEALF